MKPFHLKSIAFIFTPVTAVCALAPAIVAEPPQVSPQTQAESRKTPTPPPSKPQVIYHISKGDVAALHAQAKSQTDALAVDGSMPTSLQMSRNAANEAAAKAAAAEPQAAASPKASIEHPNPVKNVPKHSRLRAKVRGNGPARNSHPPKSHKK
jgi:hypothetical protein